MWINKKQYIKLIDQRDSARKWIDKLGTEKTELEEELYKTRDLANTNKLYYEQEIENKKQLIDNQKEQISRLDNNNHILMASNQNLTTWINKIINEVGIYEVNDKHSITIPIYKEPRRALYGNMDDVMKEIPEFLNTEEIVIPQIKFVKMK